MKAIVAVVQGEDNARLSHALRKNNIRFTTVDSTGGFLRERNATYLMGVEDSQTDRVLDLLAENCHTRAEYVSSYLYDLETTEFYMPRPIE
ncbi:MAG: cyclic-di-AMP receptor, partial [Chloroflexota bacterium]|nr:cyclic-di-AMP receptor [Chloroflexota bacterium]